MEMPSSIDIGACWFLNQKEATKQLPELLTTTMTLAQHALSPSGSLKTRRLLFLWSMAAATEFLQQSKGTTASEGSSLQWHCCEEPQFSTSKKKAQAMKTIAKHLCFKHLEGWLPRLRRGHWWAWDRRNLRFSSFASTLQTAPRLGSQNSSGPSLSEFASSSKSLSQMIASALKKC